MTGTLQGQNAGQPLPDRIGPIGNEGRMALVGSMPPRAKESMDLGPMAATTPLQGMTLVFSRSAAQEADLTQLLADQQNAASPQYHQWLTPAQFGARFGVSDNDLAATKSWLEAQGFKVTGVSPSRDEITFSGTAGAVETGFGAPLHYFKANVGSMGATTDTATHFAPANDLTLPAALSGTVMAVNNLSDYRPHSFMIRRPVANFTSSQTGNYFLSPKDVATIYDINAAYQLGYTGSGQSIVVVGQTAVLSSDISNFQSAAGVASNLPTMTLVPGTGSSTTYSGDESESDLDLEYSSSIASQAAINFVYTGNSPNYGVFDSFIYAINNDLAPIITISYGQCEPDLGTGQFSTYEAKFKQANAQGQTVINSAGDSGSSGCYGDGNTAAHQEQLAVSYPASSMYVTGVGGTEFPAADVSSSNSTYFTQAGLGDVISSAKSYIPEQAWNDDAAALSAYNQGLTTAFTPSSGGGGSSALESRPTWQTGVAGITAGSFRLVPDIALDSSPNNAPYLYCTSDPSVTTTTTNNPYSGPTTTTIASCASGFRGSDGATLTVAGGTSFAAPIFAGMLAIINQAKGYNTGQGNVNPIFYTLAANSALSTPATSPTTSTVFHDVTTGTNACNVSSSVCGSGGQTSSYAATTGYDEATGLGSFDLTNLIKAWPASTSTLIASHIVATPNTLTPATSANDAITLQVTGTGTTPTGTVTVTDNGAAATGSPVTLANGAATYTYSSATAGVHVLVFSYSGDTNYGASTATVSLNVGNTSFTISAPGVTVATGSSTTETVTVSTTNGYTGTVNLVLGTTSSSTLTNACYTGPTSVVVGSSGTGTATYTIYTNSTNCPSGAFSLRSLPATGTGAANRRAASVTPPQSPWQRAPLTVAFGGLLLMVGLRRRKLLRRAAAVGVSLALVVTLGLAGMGLTGCSNSGGGSSPTSTGTNSTNATPGTYSFIVQGNDSVTASITASTTVTLTVTN